MLCIGARATTIQVIDGLKYIIYTEQNYAVLTGNNYTQREIVIPASITWAGKKYPVTELGAKSFSNCSNLTSVTIPSSVTSLGASCFEFCSSLTSITIPSSVTSLGEDCFYFCNNLYSVNIQSPKITLDSECFASTIITDFTIMATTPPTISDDCFNGCSIDKAKLRVPKASVSSYQSAAVWKSFGTIVSVDGGEVSSECEKPSINYVSGKLKFGCQTPGAEYHYTIKAADECTESLTKNEVSLAARYDISCFATADGYTRSKTSTAKLYWISANFETDGIAPATQMRGVVVSTEGGIVTLSGLKENERVTFYNVSGIKLGETRAMNGQASISATDDIIIARIGSQSIKVKR